MIEYDLEEQRLRRTLKAIAERAPVSYGGEAPWTQGTSTPTSLRSRRVLASAVVVGIVATGFVIAIKYGPHSSNSGGANIRSTNLSSKVAAGWAISTPKGYVALAGGKAAPLGVESLTNAAKFQGMNYKDLRRAGWLSGINEEWAPRSLVQSHRPYSQILTIRLTVDQFGSSKEAASYQAHVMARYIKNMAGPGIYTDRLTFGSIPGAFADKIEFYAPKSGVHKSTTVVITWFHRGVYTVMLSSGVLDPAGSLVHHVEQLAQEQYSRIPL